MERSGLGWELVPVRLLREKGNSLSSKQCVMCGRGAGEPDQQPPKGKPGLLSLSNSAQHGRTGELGGEAAGRCRELVAGGALFILLIYSLVCCWLELQAGLGASTSSGSRLCWPRARLARGVCMGG